MKIGLDIHGLSDTNPFFKEMAKLMVAAGHEIHIITGASKRIAYRDLEKIGFVEGTHFTHVFSITNHLTYLGVQVTWKDDSNPIFPDAEWNKAKAWYCAHQNITIHFDDSEEYGKYFTTPYARLL